MFLLLERPPIGNAPISAVLAAHNAAGFLEDDVTAWSAVLESLGREYEILLIDDGSTDQSQDVAKTLAERYGQLRLLRHETRRGIGAAVRTGLEAARHPLLFYTLCNHRYQPADLTKLLKAIDKVDLVAGCRPLSVRWRRPFPAVAYRLLLRALFGIRLHDTTCFYLLARRAIFRRLPLQSDGPFAHAEIIAKANFLGCLMTEVDIDYRRGGHGVIQDSEPSFRELLAEVYRVFRRPDFGPAVLPEEVP